MLPSKRPQDGSRLLEGARPAQQARVGEQVPAGEPGSSHGTPQAQDADLLRKLRTGTQLVSLYQQDKGPISCSWEMHEAVQEHGVALDDQPGVYVNTLLVKREPLVQAIHSGLEKPGALARNTHAHFQSLIKLRDRLPDKVSVTYVGTATKTEIRVKQEMGGEPSLVSDFYLFGKELPGTVHCPVVIVTAGMINGIHRSLGQLDDRAWDAVDVRYMCEALVAELLGSNISLGGLNVGACGGGHQATITCAFNIVIEKLAAVHMNHNPACSLKDAKAAIKRCPALPQLEGLGEAAGLVAVVHTIKEQGTWANKTGQPQGEPTLGDVQSAICAHCGAILKEETAMAMGVSPEDYASHNFNPYSLKGDKAALNAANKFLGSGACSSKDDAVAAVRAAIPAVGGPYSRPTARQGVYHLPDSREAGKQLAVKIDDGTAQHRQGPKKGDAFTAEDRSRALTDGALAPGSGGQLKSANAAVNGAATGNGANPQPKVTVRGVQIQLGRKHQSSPPQLTDEFEVFKDAIKLILHRHGIRDARGKTQQCQSPAGIKEAAKVLTEDFVATVKPSWPPVDQLRREAEELGERLWRDESVSNNS